MGHVSHNFKKTTRKHGVRVVWRCDYCDSECLFSEGKTVNEVNKFIQDFYPKLVCVRKN